MEIAISRPSGVVTTAATGPGGPVVPASTGGITGLQGQKPAMTPAAQSGDTLAAQVNAMQEIEFQRLRAEGLEAQTKATAMFERLWRPVEGPGVFHFLGYPFMGVLVGGVALCHVAACRRIDGC